MIRHGQPACCASFANTGLNSEEFAKRSGKYVDVKEVARLEQYVFVPIGRTAQRCRYSNHPGLSPPVKIQIPPYKSLNNS